MSQQINLFNPVFIKQKKYFSAIAMLQALGLILLGSMLFYGYALYQVGQLRQQSEKTAKRYAEEQNRLEHYAAEYSPQQVAQSLENEVKAAELQLAQQQAIIFTLKSGAIGNTVGYSEYLRAFARQVEPGLWLTGFSITGDAAQMSLNGGVVNPSLVPIYIRRLNREKIMHGKSFAAMQMQRPSTDNGKESRYVEFALQSAEASE